MHFNAKIQKNAKRELTLGIWTLLNVLIRIVLSQVYINMHLHIYPGLTYKLLNQ